MLHIMPYLAAFAVVRAGQSGHLDGGVALTALGWGVAGVAAGIASIGLAIAVARIHHSLTSPL